ncbi:MAG: amidohydrolase family protein [Isosphaeraceae bacterium]
MNAPGPIDCLAYCGPYTRRPVGVEPPGLAALLSPLGVQRVYAGRLEALWFENPHDANRLAESAPKAAGPTEVVAVPTLDPTLPSWKDELDRLTGRGPVPMVRLYPGYHRYALDEADPLLAELAKRKIVAQVVVRIDDTRRQHPLARVADVPAAQVRDVATRHPSLKVLLSGSTAPSIPALARSLPASNNLWVDTAHADGVGTVQDLMSTPLRDRLVLGSNAPLFIPEAAFARVVLDLSDADADKVLRENARGLFREA